MALCPIPSTYTIMLSCGVSNVQLVRGITLEVVCAVRVQVYLVKGTIPAVMLTVVAVVLMMLLMLEQFKLYPVMAATADPVTIPV